jgi:hypothetical protein
MPTSSFYKKDSVAVSLFNQKIAPHFRLTSCIPSFSTLSEVPSSLLEPQVTHIDIVGALHSQSILLGSLVTAIGTNAYKTNSDEKETIQDRMIIVYIRSNITGRANYLDVLNRQMGGLTSYKLSMNLNYAIASQIRASPMDVKGSTLFSYCSIYQGTDFYLYELDVSSIPPHHKNIAGWDMKDMSDRVTNLLLQLHSPVPGSCYKNGVANLVFIHDNNRLDMQRIDIHVALSCIPGQWVMVTGPGCYPSSDNSFLQIRTLAIRRCVAAGISPPSYRSWYKDVQGPPLSKNIHAEVTERAFKTAIKFSRNEKKETDARMCEEAFEEVKKSFNEFNSPTVWNMKETEATLPQTLWGQFIYCWLQQKTDMELLEEKSMVKPLSTRFDDEDYANNYIAPMEGDFTSAAFTSAAKLFVS